MSNDAGQTLYRYRFATAEFDESRFELSVQGLPVELEQKPLRLLALLLQRRGEVVTREELVESVWEGRVTVDHALTNAVGKLRKALLDKDCRCIVTVPRVGYRLVGQVERTAVGVQLASRLQLEAEQPVAGREHYVLQRQLSASAGAEVWLAHHDEINELRVFKFALDGKHLYSLKREAALHQVLRGELGEREDFVHILDWNFDRPPFYLECEFVGENLIQWAQRDEALAQDRNQRISLFLQIADAVAAAHGVGVLHKDLKPSNVLVHVRRDGALQVKVADFGSGRMLEPERLKELRITQLNVTATHSLIQDPGLGTPLYLAPEVIVGKSATVQSDVYALGLMLYQIVVGDLRRPMASGWDQEVGDPLLVEDIGSATHWDPSKRLASVVELTQRLRSLSARHEQQAAQTAALERASSMQRALERSRARRPWVIVAVAVLLIGVVVSYSFYRAEKRARMDAQSAASRAEAINRFLNDDLLGAADPTGPGGTPDATLKQVITRASTRLAGRFQNDPETMASIEISLSKGYSGVTDYAAAEQHLRTALELLRKVRGPTDPVLLDTEYWYGVALADLNRLDEAEATFDQADRGAGVRLDENSELAFDAHMARANLYAFRYRPDRSLKEYTRADRIRAVLYPDNDQQFFRVQNGVGWCHVRLGHSEEAIAVFSRLAGPRYRPEDVGPLAWSQARLEYASALLVVHRYRDAARFAHEALEHLQAAQGPDATFVALAWNILGEIYSSEGSLPLAEEPYQQAYKIYLDRLGPTHQSTLTSLANLGVLKYKTGHLQESVRMLSQLRADLLTNRNMPESVLQGVTFYLAAAETEGRLGTPEESESLIAHLDPNVITVAEPDNDWAQRLQALHGEILLRQGHATEAIAALEPAIDKMKRDGAPEIVLRPFEEALASIHR